MSIECTQACVECPYFEETADGCCEQAYCILNDNYREGYVQGWKDRAANFNRHNYEEL